MDEQNKALGGEIRGNWAAIRAVTVAIAGKHSILLVGPKQSYKTTLGQLVTGLGGGEVFEGTLCPCGEHFSNCACSEEQIETHWDHFPSVDIVTVTERPPPYEKAAMYSEIVEYILPQLDRLGQRPSLDLDEPGQNLLDAAIKHKAILPVRIDAVKQVAATIALLDRDNQIRQWHLAEAVMYRRRMTYNKMLKGC